PCVDAQDAAVLETASQRRAVVEVPRGSDDVRAEVERDPRLVSCGIERPQMAVVVRAEDLRLVRIERDQLEIAQAGLERSSRRAARDVLHVDAPPGAADRG